MSQAELLSPSPISLPPLTYKGTPVVTTAMLADAYGCSAKNIRDNFASNRERFTEGKHFYALANGELQAFRDCTESFGAVVPARTRNLTLWLERGAARHAKMLNTDRAWDVFEMLEETFFRVARPGVKTESLTPSTSDDRKPLRSLVFAWSKAAGVHVDTCWPQVKAHFQLSRLDDLPVEWIPDALAFVQGKIDALSRALPEPPKPALPPAPEPAQPGIDLSHYFKSMRLHSQIVMDEYGDMVKTLRVTYPIDWNKAINPGTPDHAVTPMLDMMCDYAYILTHTLDAIEAHAKTFARVKRL